MGEIKAILESITHIFDQIGKFFNPIGKFYIKIQIICRVLVIIVFLDDLFEVEEDGSGDQLTCETDQIGCNTVCVNRFMPISMYQIWCFELFMVLMCISVFSGVNLYNKYCHRQMLKFYRQNYSKTPMVTQKKFEKYKYATIKDADGQEILVSAFTTSGYLLMLFLRLFCELLGLFLEANLAKHLSQNSEPNEYFQIKEHWICLTNKPENQLASDHILPPANRSSLYFRDDLNQACSQQDTSVKCWIPLSRMKSLGIRFMYSVLMFQTLLTCCEIIYEVIRLCTGRITGLGEKNSEYMRSIREKARRHEL